MEPRATTPTTPAESDTVLITPPCTPRRDDEFYCRDVVFQVENVLFKVPRRPFEQDSTVFSDTFNLPHPEHPSGCEGVTDDHPIHLYGVTEEEFRSLLWIMFRTSYGPPRTLSKDQWTHVLKLSSMWFFDAIRDKAINELTRLVRDPVSRIVLARRFQIPGWTEPALISLAQQETLAPTELEALGWAMAAKLFQVRESVVFSGTCACGCNYCSVAHGPAAANGHPHVAGSRPTAVSAATLRKAFDFTQKIREVFGTDLY